MKLCLNRIKALGWGACVVLIAIFIAAGMASPALSADSSGEEEWDLVQALDRIKELTENDAAIPESSFQKQYLKFITPNSVSHRICLSDGQDKNGRDKLKWITGTLTFGGEVPKKLKPGDAFDLTLTATIDNADINQIPYWKGHNYISGFIAGDYNVEVTKTSDDPKALVEDPNWVGAGYIHGRWVTSRKVTYHFRVPAKDADPASHDFITIKKHIGVGWFASYDFAVTKGPKTEVFDANPQYNEKFDFTDKAVLKDFPNNEAYLQRAAYIVSAANTIRSGAAADGVSLLLLRAPVDHEGIATFTLEGDGSPGTLHPIGTDFDMKLREKKIRTPVLVLDRGPDSKQYWAAALYRPPDNLGSGDGTKEVRVTLSLEKKGGKQSKDGKDPRPCTIRLIRPPVVLVHGTFDAPITCWDTPSKDSGLTMKARLEAEGFKPFMVDWEETNGHKDPSAFVSNRETVWKNKGGIREALEALRKDNFAATQADLVCHSQGGVITRRYVKGTASEAKLADDDYHYTNPRECSRGACYYHRLDNFAKGDIHRFITISATHMGSDICSLLNAFIQLRSGGMKLSSWDSLCAKLSLLAGGYQGNLTSDWSVINIAYYMKEFIRRTGKGELTGGYMDQIPGSPALAAVGKTIVPSHAIACTSEDKDLEDFDGLYADRMEKTWTASSRDLLLEAFRKLGQKEDADDLARRKDEQEKAADLAYTDPKVTPELRDVGKVIREHRKVNARRFRSAVFGNSPNDCTVRRESSLGGLPLKYTTTIPNVLHGYAPTYFAVQQCVVQLLKDDGGKFCSAGFPQPVMPLNEKYVGAPLPSPSPQIFPSPLEKTAVKKTYSKGQEFFDNEDYDSAIAESTKSITMDPANCPAYKLRGMSSARKGNVDQALTDFNKVIELDPEDGAARAHRAMAYYFQKDYGSAWKDVHKAGSLGCKVDPDFICRLREMAKEPPMSVSPPPSAVTPPRKTSETTNSPEAMLFPQGTVAKAGFNELKPGDINGDDFRAAGLRLTASKGRLYVLPAQSSAMVMPPGQKQVLAVRGDDRGGDVRVTEFALEFNPPVKSFTITLPGLRGGASFPTYSIIAFDAAGARVDMIGWEHWVPTLPSPIKISLNKGMMSRAVISVDNRFGNTAWATYSCLPIVEIELQR